MHCPRCGQKQNSEETRFCPKCGLEISDVKELLASGSEKTKRERKSEFNKAQRQGFSLILLGLIVILILAMLRDFIPIPKALFAGSVLVFMVGGMIRMVSPYIFGGGKITKDKPDAPAGDLETAKLSGERHSRRSLPEGEFQPPPNFGAKKYSTNELVEPPSVAEETTRKLGKEFQAE